MVFDRDLMVLDRDLRITDPLVNSFGDGKPPFLIGKSTINVHVQ